MALLAAVWRLLLLPGRLLIRWIDGRKRSSGVPPLGAFLRGCVHGFLGLVALMTISMATVPAPAPAAAPTVRTAPSYAPLPRPTDILESMPTASIPPSTGVDEPVYVPLPDGEDDDWDKPRICHRKWWC